MPHKFSEHYITRAKELARRSHFKGYGTGAVIVLGKEIVSEGWSHMSDVRLRELWSLHAEIHALGRARHEDLSGGVVYVATIRKTTGRIVLSKPCITCAVASYAAGLVTAYYTTESTICALGLESDLSGLKRYNRRIPRTGVDKATGVC